MLTTKGTKIAKGAQLPLSIFVFFVVFVVQIGAAGQQLPAARRSFEVASVKPSPDPRSVPVFSPAMGEIQPGGVWRATFATVFGLLRTLYPGHLLPGQIVGPDWIGTEFYDINARGTPTSSPDDLREMARKLLADRFKLVMHTEKRELPAYTLTVARGRLGPGLTKPAIDCDAYRAEKTARRSAANRPDAKGQGRSDAVYHGRHAGVRSHARHSRRRMAAQCRWRNDSQHPADALPGVGAAGGR